MEATGTVLTNKYAEGYPGRRYYGGCEHVDRAEELAIQRAKTLFGAERVNVQPHSGAQANMAVLFASVELGDTILGMDLSHGGYLTHRSPGNFSGKFYNFVPYGVDKKLARIDFEMVRKLAFKHHPRMIVADLKFYHNCRIHTYTAKSSLVIVFKPHIYTDTIYTEFDLGWKKTI